MKQELIQKEGYVLRVSPYKEADAMVTCLGKDGLFSFLARGIKKLTSKNAASCRVLTYSKFSLNISTDKNSLTLSEGIPVSSIEEKEDLLWMSCTSFLAEINARMLTEEDASEVFPAFDKTMKEINKGYPIYSACLLYFAKLLTILGYGLEVDQCVISGSKKNIVGVNYEEGGFISEEYADANTVRLPARALKILRYAFIYPLSDLGRVAFEKEESLALISQLSTYAENLTGVKLKSVSMLERC